MLQLNVWCSWWWAYVPETCRAKNTSIKLPCCIQLAFQIISWGRCTVKRPSKCMPFSSLPCVVLAHSHNIWRGTQAIHQLVTVILLRHPVSSPLVFPHIPPSTLCALIPNIFRTCCPDLTYRSVGSPGCMTCLAHDTVFAQSEIDSGFLKWSNIFASSSFL